MKRFIKDLQGNLHNASIFSVLEKTNKGHYCGKDDSGDKTYFAEDEIHPEEPPATVASPSNMYAVVGSSNALIPIVAWSVFSGEDACPITWPSLDEPVKAVYCATTGQVISPAGKMWSSLGQFLTSAQAK